MVPLSSRGAQRPNNGIETKDAVHRCESTGVTMRREGTLHIVWFNKGYPGAEPKFSVGFADYQSSGGAMSMREFTGEQSLMQFLTEDIKVERDIVMSSLRGLRSEGNANILNVVLSDEEM